MARVYFPTTPDEIESTGKAFFAKNKLEGERSPLKNLLDYDFTVLGDKDFAEWTALNQEAKNLDKRAIQLRERRDQIWKEKLKAPLLRGKDVVLSIAGGNPTIATDWGFPTTKTVKKKAKTVAASNLPTDGNGGANGDGTPPATT